MRIVGGVWRGRGLAGPGAHAADDPIRPTSDRLREAVFNVLVHAHDGAPAGLRVLDLFAGTGALGLEALSRGALHATLVDDGAAARALLRENIEALGAGGVTRVLRRDATRLGPAGTHPPVGLVFCDPPYRRGLGPAALAAAAAGGWLRPDCLVVLEEAADVTADPGPAFEGLDRRTYGDTQVVFARFAASR